MSNRDEITLEQALGRLGESATDSQAWEVVFRVFWPYVFGLCRSLLRGASPLTDAEDVAQEVFIALSRALHRGGLRLPLNEESLRALLLVMARNRARDHLRRQYRQQRDSRREVPWEEEKHAVIPQQTVETGLEQQEILERFLSKLNPFDRQVVELLFEGCKPAEIARRLHTTAKTVRRHQRWIASLYGGTQPPDST